MTPLTTAAWIGHDLALAAGLGSGLFKQLALPQGLANVASERDRAQVLTKSWRAFAPVAGVAMAIAAGTWLIGRVGIAGDIISERTRALVLAKDVCLAGVVATGAAGIVLDHKIAREADEDALRVDRVMPSETSDPRAGRMLDAANVIGAAHLMCLAGAMALTTALAASAGRSAKWSLFSRLLP